MMPKKLIADIFGSYREMEDMVELVEVSKAEINNVPAGCTSGRSWSSPSSPSGAEAPIAPEEGAV